MWDRAALTNALCDMLRGANGDVSYAAIEEAVGRPLGEIRPTLHAARRYLERDEGIVFETIRGAGLRRLTDAEKVASAARFTRRIRRTAGAGMQRLNTVSDPSRLSNADQLAHTLRMTVFAAIQRESAMDGEGK
jgi:hypothetical protein